MLASKCDVRRKTEVFANQHGIPNCEAAGKFLVVGVAKSHDKLTLLIVKARLAESEPAEAINPTLRKTVLLLINGETIVIERLASLINETVVRNREVAWTHRRRSFDCLNSFEVNFVG